MFERKVMMRKCSIFLVLVLVIVACSNNDDVSATKMGKSEVSTSTVARQSAIFYTTDKISIGFQNWKIKNLNVTKYNNGDVIPQVQDPVAWANLTTGAWCYYQGDLSNGIVYQKLYNWYAVHDPRGVVPFGWHIATDADWGVMIYYLGGENVAGGKLKSTATVWNLPNTGATNSTYFTGLPGGNRDQNGNFSNINNYGFFWTATDYNSVCAVSYYLSYANSVALRNFYYDKRNGFSVRCVAN